MQISSKQVVQYGLVFGLASLLNLVWENLHYVLYVHYKAGPITELLLVRSALVDGVLITGLVLVANLLRVNKFAIMVAGGLGVAIGLERWALATGRWAYAEAMPLIPLLHTGLTPTIQLAITGCIVLWLQSCLLPNSKA